MIWVQRLVALFVAFNSFLEIQHGFSLVTVPVVRAGHLHFLRRKENCQTANNMPDARDLWALCKNSTVMSEVIFVTHHDVRRNDAGIIAHRLDEEDLNRKVRLCLERCSTSLIQYFGTPITLAACTLKSFSSPNLRIMSRLSLVVLVASKTYKKKEKGLRKASPQDKVVTETSYLRKWENSPLLGHLRPSNRTWHLSRLLRHTAWKAMIRKVCFLLLLNKQNMFLFGVFV